MTLIRRYAFPNRDISCVLLALALAACGPTDWQSADGAAELTGPENATLGENGFATIVEAPYRDFEVDLTEIPLVRPSLEERRRTVERRLLPKIEELLERLRSEEVDNFGGWEWRWSEAGDVAQGQIGEPRFELLFVREPERTLARYTDDPLFVSGEIGFTLQDRTSVANFWRRRFLKAGLRLDPMPPGSPSFNILNTRAEFREVAEREGWVIPKGLELNLRQDFEHPAVSEDAAPFVRVFPQAEAFEGITPALATWGTIVLRDGCFFIDYEDRDDPLVQFPRGAGLFIDDEGYLAVGPRVGDRSIAARVGTQAQLGYSYPVELSDVDHELARQCGSHPVVAVTTVENGARFAADLSEIRRFRDRHDIDDETAINAFRNCWRKRAMVVANSRLRGIGAVIPLCEATDLATTSLEDN